MNIITFNQGRSVTTRSTRGLLKRLLRIPARLSLGLEQHEYRFASYAAFDFCLAARTAVTSARMHEYYGRPDAALEAELVSLEGLEQRLHQIMAQSARTDTLLSEQLLQLDTTCISEDYGWRALMVDLLARAPRDPQWLRIALTRYLEYLAQRREVIGSIRQLRDRVRREAPTEAFEAGSTPAHETRAFKPASFTPAQPVPTLSALSKGAPVRVRLSAGHEITVQLAGHNFVLLNNPPWALVDQDGTHYPLGECMNSIGRSGSNDIVLDSALGSISRRHLTARPLGGDFIELTDVSSGGVYVPTNALVD